MLISRIKATINPLINCRLQNTSEASPQQRRIDKSNSNGKIKPAFLLEEKAAIALSGPQRPVKTTWKLSMRRAAQSKSSSSLSRATGSPAAGGKVLPCSQCVCKQATLWCSQCAAAYCGICWLRSPAHSKTDIFPMQSSGQKKDADNKNSESILPMENFLSSGLCVHREFKTRVPSSKSQHFLLYHHDYEKVGTATRSNKQILSPVVVDSFCFDQHTQSHVADIRPFSRS